MTCLTLSGVKTHREGVTAGIECGESESDSFTNPSGFRAQKRAKEGISGWPPRGWIGISEVP